MRKKTSTLIALLALFMGMPPALPADITTKGTQRQEASTPQTPASGKPGTSPAKDTSQGQLQVEVEQPAFNPIAPQPAIIKPAPRKNALDF